MRFLAVFLVILTLLTGLFLGYCYQGTQMEIIGAAGTLTPAVEVLGTYNDVLAQLEDETFAGRRFTSSDFLMPESYAFLTLTVRMKNGGPLPMDYIEIQVVPDPSDVLQLASDHTPTLRGGDTGEMSVVVLTRTGASQERSVKVTYYVLGHPFTAEYPL